MEFDLNSIGKYISMLYRSANMYFSEKLKPYNIGSGQYAFLIFLYKKEGVTQEEIANSLYMDKGTTAKAIKKLEEAAFVKRIIDEKDKRANKVYLTEAGKKIALEIFIVLEQWNNALTSDFTTEEKELALKLLHRMWKNKNENLAKENLNE